jgi:hypothetical protein
MAAQTDARLRDALRAARTLTAGLTAARARLAVAWTRLAAVDNPARLAEAAGLVGRLDGVRQAVAQAAAEVGEGGGNGGG